MGNRFEQSESSDSSEAIEDEFADEFIEDHKAFDRGEFVTDMQEKERESLERSPSKIRRAFLAATAAAALMMGAAGFGGVAGEVYAAGHEDIRIESMEKEARSPEEVRLFAELEKSGYTEEDGLALVDFAKEWDVPMHDLFMVIENMSGYLNTTLFVVFLAFFMRPLSLYIARSARCKSAATVKQLAPVVADPIATETINECFFTKSEHLV